MKALSFGEVVWDVFDDAEHLGGAPFNLAAHLAQLGCESSIITSVGDDERGRKILDEIRRLGVDESFVSIDPAHPTGTVEVALTDDGLPSYTIHENVAWDFIEAGEEMLAKLRSIHFDVFCFGTLAQRSRVSRESLHRILQLRCARHVFCDINLRADYHNREIISKSLDYSTIVKLNDEEVRTLSQLLYGHDLSDIEFAEYLISDFNVDIVCVTRGAEGSGLYHVGGWEDVPGEKVEVADTVGAGDAFSAAFLKRFCEGATPGESAAFANRIGAFVASRRGAIPEYSEEIKRNL